ncbi:Rim15 [Lachancea thermotolerans]
MDLGSLSIGEGHEQRSARSTSPDSANSQVTSLGSRSGSTLSYDEYLKLATDTSASILLELEMNGIIRYVSPIWHDIVGTDTSDVVGKAISDILVGSDQDRNVFQRAVDLMLREDCSYRVRFLVESGNQNQSENVIEADSESTDIAARDEKGIIELEAQGIVISESSKNLPTHSMWIVKPFCEMGALDNLPLELVKRLGFGATIFSQYLAQVESSMVTDEADLPTPKNELCRVCESPVPAWWLETHSESCIVEHKIESMVQLLHDKLVERKLFLEEMFASLEANDGRITNYKGLPLPKPEEGVLATSEGNSIPHGSQSPLDIFKKSSNARKNSSSIFQSLSFPFKELAGLLELCDDAINTNTSELRGTSSANSLENESINLFYEFSPATQRNIEQVVKWNSQSDSKNPAVNLLKSDTMFLASQKIEYLFRLDNAMRYSLKIKNEIDNYVLQIIRERIERNRLNSISDTEVFRPMTKSPVCITVNGSENVPGGKIASPQPQKPQGEIFSDAYVGTDEIPRDTLGHTARNSSAMSDSCSNSRPLSRSVTPKQTLAEHDKTHEETRQEDAEMFKSATGTPKLVLPEPNVHPKLSNMHEFTPRRDSLASSAGFNTPLSSLQRNFVSRPLNQSFDRSPVTSPYAASSDYLTPETHTALVPKQPLSPLLLATNQAKPSTPSIKDYDIIKPISKGAYGSVFLAKRKITGEYFAIKVLKKSDMIAKNQVTNVKSERAIMMVQSNKPYVARLFATFQNRGNLFLVMEYLSGGDLGTLIKMMGSLPDKWAKQYISEVIYGVADMHESGIIHHDLKPDNLLIDRRGHLKLTDFGLSRMGLVTRHTGVNQKGRLLTNSRKGSATSEEINLGGSFKWQLKSDSPSLANAFDNVGSKAERSNSNSSSQSMVDAPPLHKSGSQLSFSMTDISRDNTPPPCSLHRHTNSSVSENWENSPTPDYALYNPDDSRTEKKFFGTPDYLAPETIKGTGETDCSDWWSVGCMLFEFFFGYPPFHAPTVEEVFSNILAGKIDWPEFPDAETEREYIPPEAKDLVEKLLVVDPNERLGANGAQEIFDHPYFQDVNFVQLYEEDGSFVPEVAHPESTDYFDLRGAQLEDFSESDQEHPRANDLIEHNSERAPKRTNSERSSQSSTPVQKLTIGSVLEPPQESGSNHSSPTTKYIPLAIPPHLRERRVSKLNEVQTEFGSFNFRNLPALDKANKDAINRLKSEHLAEHAHHHLHHHRGLSGSSSSSDTSSKLRYAKPSQGAQLPGTPALSLKGSTSPGSSKNHSPCRRDSVDNAMLSRRSAPSAVEVSPNSLSPNHDEGDSPSPAFRFKSPLSPQAASSRARLHSRTSSMRSSLGDFAVDEGERLKALSRANSTRGRRRSGRESSSGISDIAYNMDVLVCEPIPIHRFKLTRDLESLGCSVVSVSMGDEMVRRATSDVKFDLIFTALKLPKLGAIDIVKLLRNTNSVNSTTSIIAVTAYFQEAQQACAFDEVLERPVSVQQLRSLLLKYSLKKSQESEENSISDAEHEVI